MAAVLDATRPQQPRSEQNTPAAFLLALMMHALLVLALWLSVQWRTEPAGAVVVELWGAAPPPEPAVVAPPPPPPPVKAEPEPERADADIVVRQEKKAAPKAEPPPDTKKIEAEKRRAEEERRRQEAETKRLAEEKKQLEAERRKQAEATAQAAERRREDERREAVRKAEEARVLAQAGSGSAGGSPVAATGAGGRGDAGYAGLLAGLIKPRIVFAVPDRTSPSVHADFDVDLLPTGEILAVRLVKPSGLPGYDAAVERAIRRTDPFPKKADGTVDRTIRLTFRPVEK
jgi:colicin import membrane protein